MVSLFSITNDVNLDVGGRADPTAGWHGVQCRGLRLMPEGDVLTASGHTIPPR